MAKARTTSTKQKTATRARIRAQAIKALEKSGRLTAESLVQAARNPKHVMHRDFQWNDAKAAHQHRLDLARNYISEVRVTITTSTRTIVCPGYLRDRDVSPRAGYITTQRLRTDREAAQETLTYEISRAQALLERVREIAAALELEEDLQMLIGATKEFHSRIRQTAAPTSIAA